MTHKSGAWTELQSKDKRLSRRLAIAAHEGGTFSGLRHMMLAIEWSMHGLIWVVVCVVMILSSRSQHALQFLVNLIYALLLDMLIVAVLKGLIRRHRPAYNEDDMAAQAPIVDRYSFPSGHSSRAAMLATMLLGLADSMQLYQWALVSLFPPMVAMSRVIMGRHYVTDVIAGVSLGWLEGRIVLGTWLSEEVSIRTVQSVKNLWSF